MASAPTDHLTGSLIIVSVGWAYGGTQDIVGVSNTAGQSFTGGNPLIGSGTNTCAQVWRGNVTGNASDVITVYFNSGIGGYGYMIVDEFTYAGTLIEDFFTGEGNYNNFHQVSNSQISGAGLMYTLDASQSFQDPSTNPAGAPSGFTRTDNATLGAFYWKMRTAYQITGSAVSPYTLSWPNGANDGWLALIASFKEGGAGPSYAAGSLVGGKLNRGLVNAGLVN